jgi:hypothetical protein
LIRPVGRADRERVGREDIKKEGKVNERAINVNE